MNSFIESPCINKCELSKDKIECIGCGRTLEEIKLWPEMNEEEKSNVVGRISRYSQTRPQA